MENYIYKGQDITEIIKEKEKDIINLYSKNRGVSFEIAEKIYLSSKLKKAFRHVENGLWMQSEYYIIESYESYLNEAKVVLDEKEQAQIYELVFLEPIMKESLRKPIKVDRVPICYTRSKPEKIRYMLIDSVITNSGSNKMKSKKRSGFAKRKDYIGPLKYAISHKRRKQLS